MSFDGVLGRDLLRLHWNVLPVSDVLLLLGMLTVRHRQGLVEGGLPARHWNIQNQRSLPERVSLAVLQHLPSACCFACIAAELHSTESEVRDAAQMLILQQAFRPAVRQCFKCSRTEETLVREKQL